MERVHELDTIRFVSGSSRILVSVHDISKLLDDASTVREAASSVPKT